MRAVRERPDGADAHLWVGQASRPATRDLYAAYKVWCEDNAENPLSPKSFSGFIAQNADAYQLEATNNVYIGSGKRCRGYVGIEVLIRPNAL